MKIGIAGHIKPDGDCIGSCLGLYNYIMTNYENVFVDIYLDPIPKSFMFLKNADKIIHHTEMNREYDLFISVDSGDKLRLGERIKYFEGAKSTLCIDHHISNIGFADENIVMPSISSTCEVIYELLDADKIDKDTAAALYTGIIHDTGMFRYSSISDRTMCIAGILMKKGIDFSQIILDTYLSRSFNENKILAKALSNSRLELEDKCIVSTITREEMEACNVNVSQLDSIIDELNVTRGTECAVFLYETGDNQYKASLRSKVYVDVSEIALHFGGGGHIHAAGCTMNGTLEKVMQDILDMIQAQI